MLDVGLEVARKQRPPRFQVHLLAAHRHGLENEEHATREVGVGVFVAPDLASQILEPYLRAEDLLAAGCASLEGRGHPIDGGLRVLPWRSLEQHHEVVIALARNLASTPRSHEDHGRSRVAIDRAESLAAFAESALCSAASGGYLVEPSAGGSLEASDTQFCVHDR